MLPRVSIQGTDSRDEEGKLVKNRKDFLGQQKTLSKKYKVSVGRMLAHSSG
jgi:hypothetical protein